MENMYQFSNSALGGLGSTEYSIQIDSKQDGIISTFTKCNVRMLNTAA